jgi:DnaJ-class molecular chaperone
MNAFERAYHTYTEFAPPCGYTAPPEPAVDHYRTLGLSPTAAPAEIKAAYRRRVLAAHPDKGGSETEFEACQEAYRVLSDPALRLEYDERCGTDLFVEGQKLVRVDVALSDIYRGTTRRVVHEEMVSEAHGRVVCHELRIPAGCPDMERLPLPGTGVKAVVRYSVPRGLRVDGADVLMGATITLRQALCGGPVTLRCPDGALRTARFPRGQPCAHGSWWTLAGEGLPVADGPPGDIHVCFQVVFPQSICAAALRELADDWERGTAADAEAAVLAPCPCPLPERPEDGQGDAPCALQ